MKQKKIITIIKRLQKQDHRKGQMILSEPFVCLVNSYYYVRPGTDSDMFFRAVKSMITEAYRVGELRYRTQSQKAPFALALHSAAAQLSIPLIQEAFDEEYFDAQIQRMAINDAPDKDLLRTYLGLLTESQLKDFFMLNKEGTGAYSMSSQSFNALRQYFNEECCALNSAIPRMTNADFATFESKHPFYFCDYLSKETIVAALMKHIDQHLNVAVLTAKALLYSDFNFAYNCLTLLFYFQEHWGCNILDPLTLEEVKIEKPLRKF